MSSRSLHVIWCDDVRLEIGNKPSFMGVYASGMVVANLPTALERLSVYFVAYTPLEEPFRKFGFRIIRDDGTTVLDAPQADVAPPENIPEGRTYASLAGGWPLGRLELPQGCKYLQAVATTEAGEISSHKLWIDVNPQFLASTGIAVPP